jgi:hypothetical protein
MTEIEQSNSSGLRWAFFIVEHFFYRPRHSFSLGLRQPRLVIFRWPHLVRPADVFSELSFPMELDHSGFNGICLTLPGLGN